MQSITLQSWMARQNGGDLGSLSARRSSTHCMCIVPSIAMQAVSAPSRAAIGAQRASARLSAGLRRLARQQIAVQQAQTRAAAAPRPSSRRVRGLLVLLPPALFSSQAATGLAGRGAALLPCRWRLLNHKSRPRQ